jgi:hypothetical protein
MLCPVHPTLDVQLTCHDYKRPCDCWSAARYHLSALTFFPFPWGLNPKKGRHSVFNGNRDRNTRSMKSCCSEFRRGGLLTRPARSARKAFLRGYSGPAANVLWPNVFEPAKPVGQETKLARTRKTRNNCISEPYSYRAGTVASGIALLRSPFRLVLALGADGNADSGSGRRRKPGPRLALLHGGARGGRRGRGPCSLQDPCAGFCGIGVRIFSVPFGFGCLHTGGSRG